MMTGAKCSYRRTRGNRGGIVLSVLVAGTIVAGLTTWIVSALVSHSDPPRSESDHLASLYIAEAGINYELNKISRDPYNQHHSADMSTLLNPRGVPYAFANGAFVVRCMNRDGVTPWTAPNDLYILSTGTIHGVTRTVKIAASSCPQNISHGPRIGYYRAVNPWIEITEPEREN